MSDQAHAQPEALHPDDEKNLIKHIKIDKLPDNKIRTIVVDLKNQDEKLTVAHSKHSNHSKYGRW